VIDRLDEFCQVSRQSRANNNRRHIGSKQKCGARVYLFINSYTGITLSYGKLK